MNERSQQAEDGTGVAFVLGGGGHLGAHEVGMLRALFEASIKPDLILGTSVGAINGAFVAAEPSTAAVERLTDMWSSLDAAGAFGGSLVSRLSTFARSRTYLHGNERLRELLLGALPVARIEELVVSFQCVAASIERAAEHWFTEGALIDAVLASSAVPGLLPPVAIDGEHFVDGGIVNSIPVGRAVELGARTVYVLQVGRIDRPLEPPSWPWEVGLLAFEIARRHRFSGDMATLPESVAVHVLPTGETSPPHYSDLSQLRYRNFSDVPERIDRAYAATSGYLSALPRPG